MDHRADIYAYGVMAYEMLTGVPPFTGSTAAVVMAAHMTASPDPLPAHRPDVPSPLAALVMTCLARTPTIAGRGWTIFSSASMACRLRSGMQHTRTATGAASPTPPASRLCSL